MKKSPVNDYESSRARLFRFRLRGCPVWVLRGFGCRKVCPAKDCPVRAEGKCDGHLKTWGMGIDHAGLYEYADKKRAYVFRPYSMTEEERGRLRRLCEHFDLSVSYTAETSYPGTNDVLVKMNLESNMTYQRR